MVTVGIIIYPDIQAVDLAGALDCFGHTSHKWPGLSAFF